MTSELDDKKQAIRDELDKLKYEFKVELPKKIAHARSYGDLKENADYHAARERQSFVKARMGQLIEQLAQLNDLNFDNIAKDKIAYGSLVTLLDLDVDDRVEFKFVSSNEVDPSKGKISLSSPIGVALQNKKVGEEVQVNTPAGKRSYLIEKIVTIHGNEMKI